MRPKYWLMVLLDFRGCLSSLHFHLVALEITFNFWWNGQLKIDLNIISHSTAKDAILLHKCQQLVVVAWSKYFYWWYWPGLLTFCLISSSTYLDKGMPLSLALFKSNKLCASATAPSAGPSHGQKYLLKYVCCIRLTILPESSSEGMFSPIIVIFSLGHFATALLIMLNWVCNELADIFAPHVKLSLLGFCEPWILSPLVGLLTNGGCCFPRTSVLVWLDGHKLFFSVGAYNFPSHGQYLYNTSMTNWDLRTHLGLWITQGVLLVPKMVFLWSLGCLLISSCWHTCMTYPVWWLSQAVVGQLQGL